MAEVFHDVNNPWPLVWVPSSSGTVPDNYPVIGGHESDGSPNYVGRVLHVGDCIPAKVVPKHKNCFVPRNGAEYMHSTYQVLTNPTNVELVWIPKNRGRIPNNAILVGKTFGGTRLYVGRTHHGESLVPGKVDSDNRNLYIPWGNREICYNSFSVLCMKKNIDESDDEN